MFAEFPDPGIELVELSLQTDAELRAESDRRAELERENAQLEAEARNDPLTGLFNRRAFDEQFDQNLSLRIRDPKVFAKPMGIIMIDLDHFKSINDNYKDVSLLSSTDRTVRP